MTYRRAFLLLLIALLLAGCATPTPTGIPTLAVTPAFQGVTPGSQGVTPSGTGAAPSSGGAVTASAQIVPAQSVDMGFAGAGIVQAVSVSEGQAVTQGALLVQLSNSAQIEAAVSAARLEQLSAQQALNDLMQSSLPQAQAQQALANAQKAVQDAQNTYDGLAYPRGTETDIQNAETDYQLAATNLAEAQLAFDKVKNLDTTNPIRVGALNNLTNMQKAKDQALTLLNWMQGKPTSQDIAIAAGDLAVAKAQLADAQNAWDKVKTSGHDADQVALAQSRLDNANAQLAAAQAALEQSNLKAPFDGTVVSLNVSPGQAVTPGQAVLTLARLSLLQVETTDLSERDVPRVKVGQAASVSVASLGQSFPGKVVEIASRATTLGGDVVYKVTIRLDGQPQGLLWGMSATVNIGP